jgi:electron-transferring-flavoprotein dehydrogenase
MFAPVGNVFEPRALNELIPDWKNLDAPLCTPVSDDVFLFLTETKSFELPQMLLPPMLHNEGNYIISLGKLVRWLGKQAEELGVDVFPGFAASDVLYGKDGGVIGIATRDVGINKDGTPKESFTRGIELIARQTIFGEGCRGSCSESIMKKFDLRKDCQPQTYGLGVKEVWQVPESQHVPGLVQHSLGWPLQHDPLSKVFGGSFMYHMKPNLVMLGMVVGLDYENPYISPYNEFQRWKHHPSVAKYLKGGECISYGARCLNEGGYHAIPKLTFPGGALIGCSAGFVNSVKVKGTHTAMKSGMVAAEAVHAALTSGDAVPVAESGISFLCLLFLIIVCSQHLVRFPCTTCTVQVRLIWRLAALRLLDTRPAWRSRGCSMSSRLSAMLTLHSTGACCQVRSWSTCVHIYWSPSSL